MRILKTRPTRAALLGAGGISTLHAQTLTSLPEVELVGVADVDLGRAQRLVDKVGAGEAFSSLEAMLQKTQPEAVHVLLPPELHARFAVQCLHAATHVLVEKPLCISASECEQIELAARRAKRIVAVHHNVTYDTTYQKLLETIRQRRLGQVHHVTVFWSVPFGQNTFAAPLYERVGPGAVMLETGPHPLSLVVRLVGEAKQATALLSTEIQALPDTWQVSLTCERGTAQLFIGIGRPFTDNRVHVIGEDGCATADLRLGTVTVEENTRFQPLFFQLGENLTLAARLAADAARQFIDRLPRLRSGGALDDMSAGMLRSVGDFYRAIRTGGEPAASLREGLAVVRSCLRIVAAHQGKEVESCEPATASS